MLQRLFALSLISETTRPTNHFLLLNLGPMDPHPELLHNLQNMHNYCLFASKKYITTAKANYTCFIFLYQSM